MSLLGLLLMTLLVGPTERTTASDPENRRSTDSPARETWWAFQPLVRPAVPVITGPNADDMVRNTGGQGLGQINHFHAWDFRDEDFASSHNRKAGKDEIDGLAQSDPKPRHAFVGDRQAIHFFSNKPFE